MTDLPTASELIKQLMILPDKINEIDRAILSKQADIDRLEKDVTFYKRKIFEEVRKETEEIAKEDGLIQTKPKFKNEGEREFETERRLRHDNNYLALLKALEDEQRELALQKIAQDYNVRKNHNYRMLAVFFCKDMDIHIRD